jgi:small redox-active disulfide protein 2
MYWPEFSKSKSLREGDIMKIQILGTGCPKCKLLYENARKACEEVGVRCEIEKVEDIMTITELGVMMTPALVIDGEVKSVGKVLSVPEIKDLIEMDLAK